MCQQAVYDLMTCTPHVPMDAKYTDAEFAIYREGYDHALLMALKTVTAAEQRFKLIERTKRLEARRRRGGK